MSASLSALLARAARLLLTRTLPLTFVAAACSADAVPEPEPTFATKGSFIAVATKSGDFELVRLLASVGDTLDNSALFILPYLVKPKTVEEARELAKDPALPTGPFKVVGPTYITSRDWSIVWFRSVSPEEEADFR